MKKWMTLLLIAMMLLAVGGCSDKGGDSAAVSGNEPKNEDVDKTKVAVVVYTGEVEKGDFNQQIWQGVTALGDTIEASYSNEDQDKTYKQRLEEAIIAGNELIIATEPAATEDVVALATDHPSVSFVLMDTEYDALPENVVSISYSGWEGAFLAGYAAAMTTETDKVGMLGGRNETVINQMEYGYMAGVNYAAQEIGKQVEIYTVYAETYTDEARGKELAGFMYKDRCDVIFQAAGLTGLGAFQAAQEYESYVIGSDVDQSPLAPERVLLSQIKNLKNAVTKMTEAFVAGTFPGGKHLQQGIKEGGVDVALTDNVSTDIQEKIQALKETISQGELIIPNDGESYEAFMAALPSANMEKNEIDAVK